MASENHFYIKIFPWDLRNCCHKRNLRSEICELQLHHHQCNANRISGCPPFFTRPATQRRHPSFKSLHTQEDQFGSDSSQRHLSSIYSPSFFTSAKVLLVPSRHPHHHGRLHHHHHRPPSCRGWLKSDQVQGCNDLSLALN